ncbi:MAG: nitroreductase family deazaflavin-dependent oxidoreductase [Chloroflexota bacterium]
MLTPEPRVAAPPGEVLPYPKGPIRLLLRSPMMLFRLGMGELLNNFHLVILTTRGRKSGLPRHVPVEYRMHGTKVYMISGWGTRPDWVQNILVHPFATVQAGSRTYGAKAYLVEDTAEILRALFLFRKRAPAVYDAIIARLTDAETVEVKSLPDLAHQLTVVRLDVNHEPQLPGIKRDLTWVWGVAALFFGGFIAVQVAQRNGRNTD